MYRVSLKSEGGRPFFVITWPGITQLSNTADQPAHGINNHDITTVNTALHGK